MAGSTIDLLSIDPCVLNDCATCYTVAVVTTELYTGQLSLHLAENGFHVICFAAYGLVLTISTWFAHAVQVTDNFDYDSGQLDLLAFFLQCIAVAWCELQTFACSFNFWLGKKVNKQLTILSNWNKWCGTASLDPSAFSGALTSSALNASFCNNDIEDGIFLAADCNMTMVMTLLHFQLIIQRCVQCAAIMCTFVQWNCEKCVTQATLVCRIFNEDNLDLVVRGMQDGISLLADNTEGHVVMLALTLTVICCIAWYTYLSVSHLGYGLSRRANVQGMTIRLTGIPRVQKRKMRRDSKCLQHQLLALIFLCGFSGAQSMEQQTQMQEALLQRMSSMAEAATRAALAAEAALAKSTSASSSEGLSSASRILKAPDTFNGEDPMLFQQWKHQFTSWLSFGDGRYTEALTNVEGRTVPPPDSSYSETERELSQRLYAVLTSYLRGKCAHMVRSCAKAKDGFRLWHELNQEFVPSTRQRSLALAQALGAFPAFKNSALEGVLNFEQLVAQYEEASGSTYPDELKAATLIRCCQPKRREQIQLAISDTTTYKDIREKVVAYERVSKAWTSEQVLKHINEPPRPDANDGPTPMEVDRVNDKGKGKHKGKKGGKGFGGEWASAWGYGRGKGRGRHNKGKGKGKQKGKKGGGKKGSKGGDKGKKGGRGRAAYGQCSICYEYGHWSRECPNKMVQQVRQDSQAPAPPNAASSSGSPPPTQAKAGNPAVRRIFQLGSTPSSPTSPVSPQQVRMVLLYDPEEDWVQVSNPNECDGSMEWVILDSGSDVSLLPSRFQPDRGTASPSTLQNCEGGSLQTTGIKKAELMATTVEGEEVLLQRDFIVGNVTSCLVSLGQLYQGGWTIHKDATSGSLSLASPQNEIHIPVEYRNRSFAIRAHVRHITDVAPEVNGEHVRAVVYATEQVDNNELDDWEMTPDGTPFYKTLTTSYIDPRPVWGQYWPYRTTLIRKYQGESREWTPVEVSAKFMRKPDPFGMINQFLLTVGFDAECETLTFLGVQEHTLSDLGLVAVDDEGHAMEDEDARLEPRPEAEPAEIPVPAAQPPAEDPDPQQVIEVEPGQEIELAPPAYEEDEGDSAKIYDGLTVTAQSPVKHLREACQWLGISQSGSKGRMFARIKAAKREALRRGIVEAAKEQFRAEVVQPDGVPIPAQPSDSERAQHCLTHIPFAAWCKHCVSTRSRGNYHAHVSDPAEDAKREHPTIQCDFYHMEPGKEGTVVALLMVDVWSRYVVVEPLKQRNTKTVGEALAKFSRTVGHTGTLELCGDNEPVLVSGMEFCKAVRQRLGQTTLVSKNKPYDKGRTGVAERFVQTVRRLQNTLLHQLEEGIQATIPRGHSIIQWAAAHAAWLYNRFHVHGTMKTTPFQSLNGRPYKGRVTYFGQTAYGLDPRINKYKPGWRKGVWLGKTEDDSNILGIDVDSVIKTTSIRQVDGTWDAESILGMVAGPSDFFGHRQGKLRIAPHGPGIALPFDEEAEAVKAYAQANENVSGDEAEGEEPAAIGPVGTAEQWEYAGMESPMPDDSGMPENVEPASSGGAISPGGAVSPRLLVAPLTPQDDDAVSEDMDIPSVSVKRKAEEAPPGEHPKAQRMDDDPTPTPKVKAARTDAAVNQIMDVEVAHNDELGPLDDWPMEDELNIPDSEDEYIAGHPENEGPPTVSAEKLQELDAQAALAEIQKLYDMEVIKPVSLSVEEISSLENVVDTTLVYDWRFRSNQWIRRCRIVAREYRNTVTTEETFAPTSAFFAVRMILVFASIYNLAVTVLDVSDAFLMVPQVELMHVEVPAWVQQLMPDKPCTHWILQRCLPGQRNAALRWHEHFSQLCVRSGLKPFPGSPTVLKHNQIKMFVNVHVDDILLVCPSNKVEWFKQNVCNGLKLKVDGPHENQSGDQLMYLKKKVTLTKAGTLIQPNSTYIPKMVSLL